MIDQAIVGASLEFSALDRSLVTGESSPVPAGPGDEVVGGTLNGSGSFVMEATHRGRDGLLARIATRVAEAQRSRAPVQQTADAVAAVFVPTVLAIAVAANSSRPFLLLGTERPRGPTRSSRRLLPQAGTPPSCASAKRRGAAKASLACSRSKSSSQNSAS